MPRRYRQDPTDSKDCIGLGELLDPSGEIGTLASRNRVCEDHIVDCAYDEFWIDVRCLLIVRRTGSNPDILTSQLNQSGRHALKMLLAAFGGQSNVSWLVALNSSDPELLLR